MLTETISWRELPEDGMPDADDPLLLCTQHAEDGHREVWGGWWNGEAWIDDATGDSIERMGDRKVVAWAPQALGPAAC